MKKTRPLLPDTHSPAAQLTRHLFIMAHLWVATMAVLLIYATWRY